MHGAGRDILKANWDRIDFDRTDQALKVAAPDRAKAAEPGHNPIALVPREAWVTSGVSVADALFARKSHRGFSRANLTLADLSFLLAATQGVRKINPVNTLRAVPSAGARHPLETYLSVHRVDGLTPGLYRYLPLENQLLPLRPADYETVTDLTAASRGQFWDAAVYFLWTAVPYRTEWRYAQATPKLIAIDAGHVAQNLYLACEAVGCGTCAIAAYDQELADRFLGVDGTDEFVLYMAPVGKQKPE